MLPTPPESATPQSLGYSILCHNMQRGINLPLEIYSYPHLRGQPLLKMKIFWPLPNWATSPLEIENFLTSPLFSWFSRFQIRSFLLLSNYGDIEKYAISQGIKIIQATSVINNLSWQKWKANKNTFCYIFILVIFGYIFTA